LHDQADFLTDLETIKQSICWLDARDIAFLLHMPSETDTRNSQTVACNEKRMFLYSFYTYY